MHAPEEFAPSGIGAVTNDILACILACTSTCIPACIVSMYCSAHLRYAGAVTNGRKDGSVFVVYLAYIAYIAYI